MQFFAFALLLIAVVALMWIKEGSATSKRVAARDAQIQELRIAVEKAARTAEGVGKSLDTHINIDHDKWETKIDASFQAMDCEIRFIKDNLILRAEFIKFFDMVHSIDKRVEIIAIKSETQGKT